MPALPATDEHSFRGYGKLEQDVSGLLVDGESSSQGWESEEWGEKVMWVGREKGGRAMRGL
jgi:hypothetical protein